MYKNAFRKKNFRGGNAQKKRKKAEARKRFIKKKEVVKPWGRKA